jgi:hypothetical protein
MEAESNKAVIDVVERLHKVEVHHIENEHGNDCVFASLPKGMELKSLKPYFDTFLDRPERASGTTILTTLTSFTEFVNRHKVEGQTILFLDDTDAEKPAMRAVFDAHRKGEKDATDNADWQRFRADYTLPLSDEWEKWKECVDAWWAQADFAAFLEDRIQDVIAPADAGQLAQSFAEKIGTTLATAAQVMEFSRGIDIRTDQQLTSILDRGTGAVRLQYKEEHKDATGAPLVVPGAFAIGIPVFRCGERYPMPVRIRFQKSGTTAEWALCVQRTEEIFELALADAAKVAAAATGLTVFRGRPS